MRYSLVIIVLALALIVVSSARAHNLIIPHKPHSIHKTGVTAIRWEIRWQRRIIRHDRWVLRTHRLHHFSRVVFARAQLRWTSRELAQSHRRLSSALRSAYFSGFSSRICWVCWDRVHDCEAHTAGWFANTGNNFYGGLQFTQDTWNRSGGTRYADRADHATREQQIAIAAPLALSNWPVCGRQY